MKRIRFIFTAAIIGLFSVSIGTAQEKEGDILTSTILTIKPGHNAQFMAGVKIWKECYLENNGTNKWNMWRRQQGEGTVFVLASSDVNWAELDKEPSAADKACGSIVADLIGPHIEKIERRHSVTLPGISKKDWPSDTKVIRVESWKVRSNGAFEEVAKAVGDAVNKKEGDYRGVMYKVKYAGPDAADYFYSVPFTKYADLDVKRDRGATIYTAAVGQEKANETWKTWFDTKEASWTYIYELNTELSNQ